VLQMVSACATNNGGQCYYKQRLSVLQGISVGAAIGGQTSCATKVVGWSCKDHGMEMQIMHG
jgi:hypothetical protein